MDRYLYQDVNIIKKGELHNVKMLSCIRNSKSITMEPYDKDYSNICSWKKCDYNGFKEILSISELNKDTYFEKYSSSIITNLKKKISILYRENIVYDLESILGWIYEKGYFLDEMVFTALNDMINNKYMIYDRYGNSGYLINHSNYYIFQPFLIDDESIPLYYRGNLRELPIQKLILPKIAIIKDECKCSEIYDETIIIHIYENINHIIRKYKDTLTLLEKSYSNINKDNLLICEYIFDLLSFNEKCALLYGHLCSDYDLSDYELYDIFNKLLSTYLIYKEDDIYHINDISTKGKLFGFVLSYKGEPCYYEYYESKFIKCNSVQLINIQQSIIKYKDTSYHKIFCKTPKLRGYSTYNKKYDKNIFKIV